MKRLLTLLLILFVFSCQVEYDDYTLNNPKIKEAVEKRKEAYADVFMKNCIREITDQADKHVDSLITAEISFRVSDEVVFPQKPKKPAFENPDIMKDTLRARPLFSDK